MKYKEPFWLLPQTETFYTRFKERNELYEMTKPDWEIAEKYIQNKRCVVDVGGHIGTTALRYANNFDWVYAFEPVYFDLMTQNLSHVDNIEFFNYALSDGESQVSMVEAKGNSGATAILTKENNEILSKSRLRYETNRKITVSTISLDSLKLSDVDFIKLDTEGFVLPILHGMTDTLKNNDYPLLQIEFNKMCPHKNESEKFLFDMGYKHVDTFHVDHFYARV